MAAGQRAVEPGLLQLIADPLREREPLATVLRGAFVIEAREHHREVGVGSARNRRQIVRERRLQALLHGRGAALELPGARASDAERVVRVGDHVGRTEPLAERQRFLRPLGGTRIVAESKVDAPELVVEPRRFEVVGGAVERREAGVELTERELGLACRPTGGRALAPQIGDPGGGRRSGTRKPARPSNARAPWR